MSVTTTAPPVRSAAAATTGLTGVDWGLLALRVGLGSVFFAHGAQKVLGLFGGPGLSGTVQFMGQMGIPAPLAYLAALTEFLGGLAVLTGILPRLAALGLMVVMAVAILQVHLPNGFFAPKGFEYPFALFFAALALLLAGPGRLALGHWEPKLFGRRL